ncbi:hypothetical protein [Lysinibacillus fusiformis]|uniref:hypothetical protein n=1 Tax=Lysinibacillus fusiformis TaxID=28031 RepID=UPI0018822108|nr:hypothetical protein [Lysinibacillus fusiformis]MBD8523814.1 hypothetical protein [Lysinibacillus fusiformis]
MPNENSAINISPADIRIDEAGRVIINDPVLAESLIRVRDFSPGGELSCNVGDCGDTNTGNCGGGGTINAGCGRLEEIRVSDRYRELITSGDTRPLEDIASIRDHITRDDLRGGPAVDRPL